MWDVLPYIFADTYWHFARTCWPLLEGRRQMWPLPSKLYVRNHAEALLKNANRVFLIPWWMELSWQGLSHMFKFDHVSDARLFAVLPRWKPQLSPEPDNMGIVMDEVVLNHVYLPTSVFSRVSIIPRIIRAYSINYQRRFILLILSTDRVVQQHLDFRRVYLLSLSHNWMP